MPETGLQLTQWLRALEAGDAHASEELLPLVYDELRRLAAWKMALESPGHTLQATALVHEAWLRLVGSEPQRWQNRAHFLGAAAEAMRRILVESARRKRQLKRGGQWQRIPLEGLDLPAVAPDDKVLLVHEALEELAKLDPVEAQVVKLHYFAGLNHAEIGELLGLSERTVKRYWSYAKVWLYRQICEQVRACN
jgi:RNA polymerase sigma factor (TIGR02999 family)